MAAEIHEWLRRAYPSAIWDCPLSLWRVHLRHLARKDYRTPSATAPLFLSLSSLLSFSSHSSALTFPASQIHLSFIFPPHPYPFLSYAIYLSFVYPLSPLFPSFPLFSRFISSFLFLSFLFLKVNPLILSLTIFSSIIWNQKHPHHWAACRPGQLDHVGKPPAQHRAAWQ